MKNMKQVRQMYNEEAYELDNIYNEEERYTASSNASIWYS
jgi:hypothetical protein